MPSVCAVWPVGCLLSWGVGRMSADKTALTDDRAVQGSKRGWGERAVPGWQGQSSSATTTMKRLTMIGVGRRRETCQGPVREGVIVFHYSQHRMPQSLASPAVQRGALESRRAQRGLALAWGLGTPLAGAVRVGWNG